MLLCAFVTLIRRWILDFLEAEGEPFNVESKLNNFFYQIYTKCEHRQYKKQMLLHAYYTQRMYERTACLLNI